MNNMLIVKNVLFLYVYTIWKIFLNSYLYIKLIIKSIGYNFLIEYFWKTIIILYK